MDVGIRMDHMARPAKMPLPVKSRSFIAAAFCVVATVSGAQTVPNPSQCATRDKVVGVLAAKYGETRHGIGLSANNTVMEVFASDATGTWTITVTMPSGVTCMVASGQGYEALREPLPVPGEPT